MKLHSCVTKVFTANALYRIFLTLRPSLLVPGKCFGYEINPDISFVMYLRSCKSYIESLLITYIPYYIEALLITHIPN